jgi:hypothetical protein
MRRIIALGVALTGVAALALPLTQAVAQSGDAHPTLHAERLDAATLNSGALDASLAIHARRAGVKKFYVAVAYAQALEAARAAASRRSSSRSSGGGGGGGGGTCAGSIPGHIIYRESKCDPRAVNSRSGAAGKYQVLESTWDGYGGYQSAADAPEELQDQWAAEAYAAAGCRPWGGC